MSNHPNDAPVELQSVLVDAENAVEFLSGLSKLAAAAVSEVPVTSLNVPTPSKFVVSPQPLRPAASVPSSRTSWNRRSGMGPA